MAILSVEVPDKIAKKFTPYKIVKLSELNIENQILNMDGEGWETIVDFGKGVNAKDVLSYLEKKNG